MDFSRSDYYKTLSGCEQKDYKAKLCCGELQLHDPYEMEGWQKNMKLWPPLSYADLYNYLIQSPERFTYQSMKSYKSLEAYNYFVSGHVRAVKFNAITPSSPVCFMKAEVMSSQKLNDPPHVPWVCIHKEEGYVTCAHCTCLAGLGEACSHVGALLFSIEAAVKDGSTACTSLLCEWKVPSGKKMTKSEATPIEDIDFTNYRHEAQRKRLKLSKPMRRKTKIVNPPDMAKADAEKALADLKKICPTACIFTKDSSDTDSASEDEDREIYPELISNLHRPEFVRLSDDQLAVKVNRTLTEYHPTTQQIENLERDSKSQSLAPLWKAHRKGRVTACIAHKVFTMRDTTDPSNLIEEAMGYEEKDLSHLDAIAWGNENEAKAREDYIKKESASHEHFECNLSGFVISKDLPFIGASPDGVVSCDCCYSSQDSDNVRMSGLLEIKCAYKHRFSHPYAENVLNDKSFYLDKNGKLKRNHKYHTQVQFQMFVCKKDYCDFAVWTTKGVEVDRVFFDAEFNDRVIAKVTSFITRQMIPEILTKKLLCTSQSDTEQNLPQVRFCVCNRPPFGRMLECSNGSCDKRRFHYECLGITRKPRGKWFCQECQNK